MMKSFYDFKAEDAMCEMRKMEEYRGKVVLVVNTATQCGFTPQYDDCRTCMRNIRMQGFKSLIFPAISLELL